MLTPKIAESVSLIMAVVDSESVTCQLDEDTENPAIRSKVPGTLPTFEIVELNETQRKRMIGHRPRMLVSSELMQRLERFMQGDKMDALKQWSDI